MRLWLEVILVGVRVILMVVIVAFVGHTLTISLSYSRVDPNSAQQHITVDGFDHFGDIYIITDLDLVHFLPSKSSFL